MKTDLFKKYGYKVEHTPHGKILITPPKRNGEGEGDPKTFNSIQEAIKYYFN